MVAKTEAEKLLQPVTKSPEMSLDDFVNQVPMHFKANVEYQRLLRQEAYLANERQRLANKQKADKILVWVCVAMVLGLLAAQALGLLTAKFIGVI